jgi:L-lactate dehydrogenase complex protein LldF
MQPSPRDYVKVSRQEAANKQQSDFLTMVSNVFNYLCDTAMADFGTPSEQEEARRTGGKIRSNSLAALPELLEEFEANATRNGIKVLWAEDAQEACRLVEDLVRKHDVKVITKGKSMISEEIGLNHYLEKAAGVKIFEGDLGEFIVQQRGTMPFHIVGPAINLNVKEIAEILGQYTGMPYTEAPAEIAAYMRGYLREQFERADMGITGVNQAVASTGSILLVENEGNIRWSTSAPRVHVALMSIEKVAASLEDALFLLGLLTRNCTGQLITSYVSMLSGPRPDDQADGPEAMYVIIIDNGRSRFYPDPELKEALRCIRCGRCGIKCPIYLHIGAYPYGNCYPGCMGQVLIPLLMGLDDTYDLYESCTLCGACQSTCPGGVPHLDLYERYRAMKTGGESDYGASQASWQERLGFRTWSWGVNHPSLYKTGLGIAQKYLRKAADDGYIKTLPGPMQGWFECRDLPAPPEKGSFHRLWQQHLRPSSAKPDAAAGTAPPARKEEPHEQS